MQRTRIYSILCSIEKYNVAHLLHSPMGGEKTIVSCVARHLYAANRLQGPVIVVCRQTEKDGWENAFHAYTQLKVAVMSGSSWECA